MNLNQDPASLDEIDDNNSNIREIIFKYLNHWKWFLCSIVMCLILGYTYIKLTTPLYKIETYLLIKDNKDDLGGQNDLLKDLNLFSSDKIIDNEIQILKSKTILEKVIQSLKLETSYYTSSSVRNEARYNDVPFDVVLLKPSSNNTAYDVELSIRLLNINEAEVNGKRVKLNTAFQTEAGLIEISSNSTSNNISNQLYSVKFNDIADLIQHYNDKLRVDAVSKQATVLEITLEDAIPQRGVDFLNRLVQVYNEAALEDKNIVTSRTLAFIDDRLKSIGKELGTSELNVEQYKSNASIANIGAQSQILLQGVGDNDTKLSKVEIQLEILNNLENYLIASDDQGSSLPSMLSIDDPTLIGLVQQLGEAQQKKVQLLQTVPESNPLVSSLNVQINGLKRAISSSVQNLKRGLLTTKKQLESKNYTYESTIKQVPFKERGLIDVMRQQHLKDTLYRFLLQKREEAQMNLASGVADSRTIDKARSSKYPVTPIKKVIYAIFILAGIIIPIVIIYIKELLNFRVTRRSDVEMFTTIPIIAEIAHSDHVGPLLVVDQPRSMVSEQIRAFRTNLQFVLPNANAGVMLFTSSISGEGKSFVSLNLGGSLAMSDKKVVILELDLRKPKLRQALNLDCENGLSNFLIGKVDYKEILIEIPNQKGYYLIPSGPIPPNPAELISNGNLKNLIEKLKVDFDYIILDAPPIGLVTDAQLLGFFADVTIFIVRHNYTSKNMIHVIENFGRQGKFKNLNIVLNNVEIKKRYGYYGYGGYYQEEAKEKKSWFRTRFNNK